jgi:D-alanyl-D-alanine carboxypeptidase
MAGKTTRLPSRRGLTTALVLAVGAGAVGCGSDVAAGRTSAHVTTAPATVRAAGPSPAGRLEKMADQSVAAGVPGVIVRVNDGHGPVVNIARQAPWTTADHRLTANDEFRMGSNTKTVTATLVLQLVAEHRLALDDSIEKWLPGAIPNGPNITVRMLLNHTSGLADYAYQREVLDLMTGRRKKPPTAEELLAVGTKMPVVFPPGKGFNYSNPGYIALGLVLEKVTGRSMSALIQQRIARPLGLRHTSLPTNSGPLPDADRLAHGYEPDATHLAPLVEQLGLPEGYGFIGPNHDDRVDVTAINQAWDGAAGAIISTTSDWARFDTALMSGRLLPRRMMNQMRTVVDEDEASGPDRKYGLGLERYQTPCGTVWGHDGALPGYRSDNYTDETGRRTVAVLSSTQFGYRVAPDMEATQKKLVTGAICTMLGKPIPAAG